MSPGIYLELPFVFVRHLHFQVNRLIVFVLVVHFSYNMLAFVLLASLLTFAGADCPNRQRIEESLREVHIPGAAIVAVNAHGIVYEHAFGYQSLLPSKPMDVDQSIFVLASISKTFIAVAVMQLVEQKLVDLDTDVNQYLNVSNRVFYNPTFPNQTLTLRQLLSHSSSIALAEHLQSGLYQPGDSAPAKESLAQMCFKYSTANTTNWLPRPPGNATLYSNEGTSLAALVVERMTEIPFHQYVKEKIFQPLNVSHMGVFLSNFTDTNDLVRHYAYAQDASFLQLWNAEFPQLNIEAMPVGLAMITSHSSRCFCRETPRAGCTFRFLATAVIPPDSSACLLVHSPPTSACSSIVDTLFFRLARSRR